MNLRLAEKMAFMAGIEQLTNTKIRSLTPEGNGFHADGGHVTG